MQVPAQVGVCGLTTDQRVRSACQFGRHQITFRHDLSLL
ncbi:hypothetical protein [Cryobacterium sp. MLB-32]